MSRPVSPVCPPDRPIVTVSLFSPRPNTAPDCDLAITDPLTGSRIHRGFQEEVELSLRRAERVGGPVSLVMLDLDQLGVVNDRPAIRDRRAKTQLRSSRMALAS